METDQREDEALEVLNEVVESPQTIRIFALLYLKEGTDLGGSERNMLIAEHNLQLLPAYSVRGGPVVVVFFHDFTVFNDSFELLQNGITDINFSPDDCVILVI
eukprot:GILI01006914.1.p2 GENE.GILI01006914.1~~GILI01006914.1.p2  ORF type:complete len:103 (+),score=18.99 GILI01006914.1:138-446(+)